MIIINGKLKVPSRFDEISLRKGIEVMSTLEVKPKPSIEDKIFIIAVASDISLKSIVKWDKVGVDKVFSEMSFSKDYVYSRYFNTFRINNKVYGFTDLSKLTVKELAQIDYYLNEGDTAYDYLPEVIGTLFRPVKSYKNKSVRNILNNIVTRLMYKGVVPIIYDSYEIEALSDDDVDVEIFNKLDFSFGYAILNEIRKYKEKLREDYYLLFSSNNNEEEDEDQEEISKLDILSIDEIWTWYHWVANASTTIFEREAWWTGRVTHFLKYLSYLKQLSLHQKAE